MSLDTVSRSAATYFVGNNVDNTPMKGEHTLFVVGCRHVDEIAKNARLRNIRHIYLGASQSFNPTTNEEWDAWDSVITTLLEEDFWITLDFDVKHADTIHEEGWCESNNFIPLISVKLPYIKLYNYNTSVRIDDTSWKHSNPGTWCHSLHDLMDRKVFTDWKEYNGDKQVDE
jgi:hypothetical protein